MDTIKDYILRTAALSEEEVNQFVSSFTPVKAKRRQFIVQPGFVARHRYFVVKGALRAYVIGEEGQEYTIQLAIEDWWISDYNSYIYQQPATMFVMAMEDCELLQISHEDEWKLKATSHRFETFFRQMAERSTAFMQRRIITNLTQSAEERYDHFMAQYPLINERMPQYVIASYLGMTTEFLSKIRNNKVSRKS
ncbi:cAMP-binding domain of CRP or a regulatory subunit of cAMP-dependent protein kinases [Filimonas lacunae]|uniref:cAMP-binding domain of CRP or a regulatory subunit of cAMP-dependent protein kinases n=1 Tax=Filimonas lacunae TaxID=477680 RepID=A0A173MHP8_9BACT|nr:Crp/Fnr family transcriptional regulator [Filimonas lacunae]BAV07019.1 Crp/Fnr family transcriptional regulator [Filimonas lacunae]SIS96240.1 cAMP-binding domain of CRP or a regulatory subunit of cAMP-dependent protein kinases [Filimonas lacunae]